MAQKKTTVGKIDQQVLAYTAGRDISWIVRLFGLIVLEPQHMSPCSQRWIGKSYFNPFGARSNYHSISRDHGAS